MSSVDSDVIHFRKAPDVDSVIQTAQELDNTYPFAKLTCVGASLRGRCIPMITLGEGKKAFLYVASHHASEWICSSVLLRFAVEFSEAAYGKKILFGIDLSRILSSLRLCIVPMLNPDGVNIQQNGVSKDDLMYDRLISMNGSDDFSKWQANGRGVDLNHNYDAGFYEYKAIEKQFGTGYASPSKYSGEYPESEPEVLSLCNRIRFDDGIAAAMTLHTQGEVIYCTHGKKSLPHVQGAAKALSVMTGYKIETPEGSAAYGGMTDWFIDKLSKPCFTLECGLGENPLPLSQGFAIYTKLREALFTFPILF